MADTLSTPRDVIDNWPSLRAFADDIGVAYGTAKAMRRRDSIPVEYWPAVIGKADQREIHGITYEFLALMHARRAGAALAEGAAP